MEGLLGDENHLLSGLIKRSQSGFFTVETEIGDLVCTLRGRLKRGKPSGDIAAIGDRVRVRRLENGTGLIEEIEPRDRMISRRAPLPGGEYEQIIIANPDQLAVVFACANPEPRLRMLDRFLVIAEKQEIPAVIIANKIDLVEFKTALEIFGHYRDVGYKVIYTSAHTGYGLDEFKGCLEKKITALTGPSGAGKTSLLNAIHPGFGLAVREVSRATRKGKHTTVISEMFPLPGGGYVADTPGLRSLALWDIEPEELDAYFPEIRPLVSACQFSDCTHLHEPGCAVREAVEHGKIHPQRYESYVRLRMGEDAW